MDRRLRREPFAPENGSSITAYLDGGGRLLARWRERRGPTAPATPGGNSDAMTKSELIQRLAERNPHLYQRDIEKIVGTIFDEITDALARGDRVELRGFGAFSVKRRDARTGRNPRTGESVDVGEKCVPFFKTGKQLRERLNTD